MILTWHFTFFLINVFIWIVAGLTIGKFLVNKKAKLHKITKFLVIGIFGALFGGLIGFVANGTPDVGVSVSNLVSAMAFSALPVLALNPKNKIKTA